MTGDMEKSSVSGKLELICRWNEYAWRKEVQNNKKKKRKIEGTLITTSGNEKKSREKRKQEIQRECENKFQMEKYIYKKKEDNHRVDEEEKK